MEWIVALAKPRNEVTDAPHFRSTWITASQATIRSRGLGPKYEEALDPERRTEVLAVVAGVWLPMNLARVHYAACDALNLPEDDLIEIGRLAMRKANATTLSFITRLAKGAGVTPWTVLAQMPRIMAQTMDGGAVAVGKLGPKDARVEVLGYPLAELRYNRITMRGIMQGGVEMFCRKAYSRELPELCDSRSIGLQLTWV